MSILSLHCGTGNASKTVHICLWLFSRMLDQSNGRGMWGSIRVTGIGWGVTRASGSSLSQHFSSSTLFVNKSSGLRAPGFGTLLLLSMRRLTIVLFQGVQRLQARTVSRCYQFCCLNLFAFPWTLTHSKSGDTVRIVLYSRVPLIFLLKIQDPAWPPNFKFSLVLYVWQKLL